MLKWVKRFTWFMLFAFIFAATDAGIIVFGFANAIAVASLTANFLCLALIRHLFFHLGKLQRRYIRLTGDLNLHGANLLNHELSKRPHDVAKFNALNRGDTAA